MDVVIIEGQWGGEVVEVMIAESAALAFGPVMEEGEGRPFLEWYRSHRGDPSSADSSALENDYNLWKSEVKEDQEVNSE